MLTREVRILMRKELRQLLSSKSAVITAAIVPLMMLVFVPLVFFSAGAAGTEQGKGGAPPVNFGLIGEVADDPKRAAIAIFPMMVSLVGMIVPLMMASFLLIIERERRTLELLIALPIRLEQVVKAKLGAVVLVSGGITLPLVCVDAIMFASKGQATPGEALALPVLLICALGYSTAASLLLSLLARDLRTANNIAGAIVVPTLFLTMALGMVLPGGVVRPLCIAALFLVVGLVIARIALRSVTYERLLS